MPSSPKTPSRRRKSSVRSLDHELTPSPRRSSGVHSRQTSINRKDSQNSIPSHTSPFFSALSERGHISLPNGEHHSEEYAVPEEAMNGLGNLADELAEAFEEDGEGDTLSVQLEEQPIAKGNVQPRQEFDDNSTSEAAQSLENIRVSHSPENAHHSSHRRKKSRYEGSEARKESGMDTDAEDSCSLDSYVSRMEKLVSHSKGDDGYDADNVIQRVTDFLRTFPPQTGIENGTSRIITAHIALTSHMTNQARSLQTLSHPLTSPLALPPESNAIDDLLPVLVSLLASLPIPNPQCLSSLHSVRTSTSDLQSTLSGISDSIHMTRQTMSQASRKLRSVTELVIEMRKEAETREEAIRWIEKGCWEKKLAERECRKVCGEVIGSFEENLQHRRQLLVAALGSA